MSEPPGGDPARWDVAGLAQLGLRGPEVTSGGGASVAGLVLREALAGFEMRWMAPDWTTTEAYRRDARFNPAERMERKRRMRQARSEGGVSGRHQS